MRPISVLEAILLSGGSQPRETDSKCVSDIRECRPQEARGYAAGDRNRRLKVTAKVSSQAVHFLEQLASGHEACPVTAEVLLVFDEDQ